jgi:hypothetical protein
VDQRREVGALEHFRRHQMPMPLLASGIWGPMARKTPLFFFYEVGWG